MADATKQEGVSSQAQGSQGTPAFSPSIEFSEDKKNVTWKRAADDVRVLPADKIHGILEKGTGFDEAMQKHSKREKEWKAKEQRLGTYDALFGDDVLNALADMQEADADAAIKRIREGLKPKPAGKAQDDLLAWLNQPDPSAPKPLTEADLDKHFETRYEKRREQERRQDTIEGQLNQAFDELGIPDDFRGDVREAALRAAVNENSPEKQLRDYVKERVAVARKAVAKMDEAEKAKAKQAEASTATNITQFGVPAQVKAGDALKTAPLGSPEWRKAAAELADSLGVKS